MPTVSLSWVDPSTSEPQHGVFELPLSVGRAPDNALQLGSATVSGHHASIRVDPGGILVEDLRSRNGISVNGQRVPRALIVIGDVITIGPFELVVRLEVSDIRVRFDWQDPHGGQQRSAVHRLPVSLGTDRGNDIVLADPHIAPRHIVIQPEGSYVVVSDLTGAASIATNGQWQPRADLAGGVLIQIGPYRLVVTRDSAARRRSVGESTIVMSDQVLSDMQRRVDQQASWPPAAFAEKLVPMRALAATGLGIGTTDYLTIGAGIGGFIWVDNLVVRGVKAEQIVALGVDPIPYGRYKRLCRNSQIPDHERLRSDSPATPDNVWGWPGYAAREIVQELKQFHLGTSLGLFWQIFGEPSLSQTYTPRASDVFRGMDVEAKRIGWDRIVRYGRVRAIRKTDDGRYVVAYSQSASSGGPSHALIVAQHLHLATGYPALQFLPDLQKYREETEDFASVVNAYEDHSHVYSHLEQHGGLVVLRGRGIVASRILQRLHEARAVNPRIIVVHLMRTPLVEGHKYGRAQRRVDNHFELQPFNWPKSCWGGDLRELLEKASPEQRKLLLTDWGGTTTAKRDDWLDIVQSGVRDGWYQIVFGEVERVERDDQGRLSTLIRGQGDHAGRMRYDADFVIDATGLDAKASSNPLLSDLIGHYSLELNPLKRLHVEPDFGVPGLHNEPGLAFAAGSMTAGGPFAPVDSFLGLQYMAQVSLDALVRAKAPGLRNLGPARSIAQWMKWVAGSPP